MLISPTAVCVCLFVWFVFVFVCLLLLMLLLKFNPAKVAAGPRLPAVALPIRGSQTKIDNDLLDWMAKKCELGQDMNRQQRRTNNNRQQTSIDQQRTNINRPANNKQTIDQQTTNNKRQQTTIDNKHQ